MPTVVLISAGLEWGATVPLFNPRMQNWVEHFAWSADGIRILGRTSIGRATVAALHLSDDPDALAVRSYYSKEQNSGVRIQKS